MDIDRLGESPIGQLVPVRGTDARHGDFAFFAFLPAPLPDDVDLASSTWTCVTEATASLARLQQACLQLPDPRLLIRPALWRESLDTSALEGTVGALQELLESELPSASAQFVSAETQEIRAFSRVALRAFELVKHRPVSTSLLCELQAELFANVANEPRDLGQVREHVVWIGEEGRPIEEARFVPAPPDDRLKAGMDAWERWVQVERSDLPAVLRAALAHYQLETLHPFGDGNGRLGRLVAILQILQARALDHPAVTLSPWLLRRRVEYQEQLLAVSCTGDWNPWVSLFCHAICDQCDLSISHASKLVEWLDDSRRILHERRWSGAVFRLLEDLIEWPITTITDTASRYGVSPVHATRMVKHLEEVGILSELTGKSYGRVFGATYVMDTVDSLRGG